MPGHDQENTNTVKLAERRIFTESFRPLYNEGMSLVEQAAEYLDGEGRIAAKTLSHEAATLYAAESMRLTTRLMQLASWLLLQRAANSGEMTREQVSVEKSKVRLDTISAQDKVDAWAELPEMFQMIVDHSMRLQALVRRMDDEIYGGAPDDRADEARRAGSPVTDQIRLLQTAFGRV